MQCCTSVLKLLAWETYRSACHSQDRSLQRGDAGTFSPPQLELPQENSPFKQILPKRTEEQKQAWREGGNRCCFPIILQSTGCGDTLGPHRFPLPAALEVGARGHLAASKVPRCQQLSALIKVRSAHSRAQRCTAKVH